MLDRWPGCHGRSSHARNGQRARQSHALRHLTPWAPYAHRTNGTSDPLLRNAATTPWRAPFPPFDTTSPISTSRGTWKDLTGPPARDLSPTSAFGTLTRVNTP